MSANAAGRTIWTDKTRSDLLQAVLAEVTPSPEAWEKIQGRLAQQGYHYTPTAAL